MSVLAYGLVLLGCSDDGSACRRLEVEPLRYVAAAACEAQVETALLSDAAMRADYPIVEARCVRLDGKQGKSDQTQLARR